jgi:CO/xanthine dehydrogenase FAD-binding subunit
MDRVCQEARVNNMWKKYLCASSIDDTLKVLADHLGKSKIIAGGTDLVLELEKGACAQNDIQDRRVG